ncbi:MAG: SIS domain-containing protein [Chloroflexi bacterium]|nr:SIS domain-containing protein [Chloroflexota bacterium]
MTEAAAWTYFAKIQEILEKISTTQREAIEQAATICADSICNDGLVFCWGGGHSRMSVEEMFPRIGSYPGFYPMVELALTYYTDFVGANGMPQSFFLERQEGYVAPILANYEFGPHDSMICFSSTGINELVIEMAIQAKQRGLPVIAVTSVAHADSTVSRHSSGRKLKDVADVVLDNCTPPGDAVLDIPGVPYKVSPTSSIGAFIIVNTLKARTAEMMAARGVEPVVLTSPHFAHRPGEAQEQLQRVYKEFKRRKRMIYGRD